MDGDAEITCTLWMWKTHKEAHIPGLDLYYFNKFMGQNLERLMLMWQND
jgi:hypothetical protein